MQIAVLTNKPGDRRRARRELSRGRKFCVRCRISTSFWTLVPDKDGHSYATCDRCGCIEFTDRDVAEPPHPESAEQP